ncbi:hypothetical protein M0R45_009072 [Rubus argutus]|uniref:Uncharacterized protein n=1 Tax=Rubus argutus TaxID=59490 RepID=A0AAW1Y4T6_RUBAR
MALTAATTREDRPCGLGTVARSSSAKEMAANSRCSSMKMRPEESNVREAAPWLVPSLHRERELEEAATALAAATAREDRLCGLGTVVRSSSAKEMAADSSCSSVKMRPEESNVREAT